MSESTHGVSQYKRKFLATIQPTCYLCGYEMLKPDVDKPKVMSPSNHRKIKLTVDHLIPLSCETNHSFSNLKLAHAICNELRGSKPISPQIRCICKNTIEQILRYTFCSVHGGNIYIKRFNEKSKYKLDEDEFKKYQEYYYEYSSSSSVDGLPESSSTSSL